MTWLYATVLAACFNSWRTAAQPIHVLHRLVSNQKRKLWGGRVNVRGCVIRVRIVAALTHNAMIALRDNLNSNVTRHH